MGNFDDGEDQHGQWEMFVSKTQERIVDLFIAGSHDMVMHKDGWSCSASVALVDMALDSDEVFKLISELIVSSKAPDVIAFREKAGRIWAEKHCMAQAIFDEKHLKDDSYEF